MICLALDTSGPYASVAIVEGRRVLIECSLDAGRTHSETVMPLIDRALSTLNLLPGDIDLFAAANGPGSFTGVRIGVLTVKALAHAAGKPCAGVSTLAALNEGAGRGREVVAAMLDARRDQVYAAAFLAGERILADEALSVSEFLSKLPDHGDIYFTGDGALRHAEEIVGRFGSRAALAAGYAAFPKAAAVAALAMERPESFSDYLRLEPAYLRPTQAERERTARDV